MAKGKLRWRVEEQERIQIKRLREEQLSSILGVVGVEKGGDRTLGREVWLCVVVEGEGLLLLLCFWR